MIALSTSEEGSPMSNLHQDRLLLVAALCGLFGFLGFVASDQVRQYTTYLWLVTVGSGAIGACILSLLARGVVGNVPRAGLRTGVSVGGVVLGAGLGALSSIGHHVSAHQVGYAEFTGQFEAHMRSGAPLPYEPVPAKDREAFLERERLFCFRVAQAPAARCLQQAFAVAVGLEAVAPSQRHAR